jgi:hypothetical protein
MGFDFSFYTRRNVSHRNQCFHDQRLVEVGLTFKYSFVASCHSLVMVLGGGLAKEWMIMKRATDTAQPIPV